MVEINPSSQVNYKCWFGLKTCTIDINTVLADFKDDAILKNLLTKPDAFPLVQGRSFDPESNPEADSIEIINQALCLLGLTTPQALRKNGGMDQWSDTTVAALAKFQKIANLEPGSINGKPAPGKVFGKKTAKALQKSLVSVSKGGTWQTAVKIPD